MWLLYYGNLKTSLNPYRNPYRSLKEALLDPYYGNLEYINPLTRTQKFAAEPRQGFAGGSGEQSSRGPRSYGLGYRG